MREVVITDIEYRMTMTVIWSLGRKGIDITAVAYDDSKSNERIGFFSKYVKHRSVIPHPKDSVRGFVNGLTEIGKEILERSGEKAILFIPRAQTHEAILQYHDLISPLFDFNIVCGENLERANNTFLLSQVAKEVKVPFPETTWLDANETISALSERIKYPVVVKYRFSEKLSLKPEKRYAIVNDPENFVKIYTLMHEIQESPLVQSYISGHGFGVSCVFNDQHEPVEIFCHKRLREYPVSGGPSTLCESVWDDNMVQHAVNLLKALNWKGFAMVEFKGDQDGDVHLMEINPRFWGSMMLSLYSGCDMPFAYYKSVMHLSTAHEGLTRFDERYTLGVKMQFMMQDLLSVVQTIKRSPIKVGLILDYLYCLINPNIKDGLIQIHDFRPGVRYLLNAFGRGKKA